MGDCVTCLDLKLGAECLARIVVRDTWKLLAQVLDTFRAVNGQLSFRFLQSRIGVKGRNGWQLTHSFELTVRVNTILRFGASLPASTVFLSPAL